MKYFYYEIAIKFSILTFNKLNKFFTLAIRNQNDKNRHFLVTATGREKVDESFYKRERKKERTPFNRFCADYFDLYIIIFYNNNNYILLSIIENYNSIKY